MIELENLNTDKTWKPFWRNFMFSINYEQIDENLKKYNGCLKVDGLYFLDTKSIMFFLLKWS